MILLCFVGLAVSLLCAQFSSRPSKGPTTSSLRATAILELAPNGRARLVPIAIKVGDRFFDGGLYRADPSPMTLQSGTVYEAERAGSSVGLFTVTQSQEVSGTWVGLGQWRSNSAPQPEKSASAAPAPHEEDSDEPPVLRKSKPAPAASGTPAPVPIPTASPSPETRTAVAEKSPATPTSSSAMEDDPNRPVLRRGKPATRESSDELPPMIAEKPGAAHSTPAATSSISGKAEPPAGVEVLAAVSDAHGPTPRSYVMQLGPEERERREKAVRQLAYAAISKYAAARPQHKPAPAAAMADVQFQAYDANYNNEPDFVLSAALPESLPGGASSAFRYFVTVVARVDLYGELHQLFAQVTDSAHLDAYARLELVDVVDAEGSGAGQLLFREVSDTGYDFVLYRIGADKLWPLFQGAGKNF